MTVITNKIYAVIPARSGSKSIVDKNIQKLGKHTLLAHSILAAQHTPEIDRVIVSTDSKEYKKIAEGYNIDVPFLRPKCISGDNNADVEWVAHLLNWLIVNERELPKYLVHLRPTTPLRNIQYIRKAIKHIKQYPEATALRSVVRMERTVYKYFEVESLFLKTVCSGSFDIDIANKPRQLYPITYLPNGYVDILKTEFILDVEKKKIHGNKVLAFLVPKITDIDDEKDLKFARWEIDNA